MRGLLTFCLFLYSTLGAAAGISISVQGVDTPVNCSVEKSIGGYFCLEGDNFLILQDSGRGFFATGNLEGSKDLKSYTVNKVYSDSDNTLLYERAPSPFDNMSFGDVKLPPESLKGKASKLSMQIFNLENYYKNNRSKLPHTKEFSSFLSSKLATLKGERDKLSREFEGNTRIVEFENGDKVSCQRLPEKEKSKEVIAREERLNESIRCGVFSCSPDSKGNKRLLLSHFGPGQDFADMLYLSHEGPVNGSKLRRILSPTSSTPISDFSHYLDPEFMANTAYVTNKPEVALEAFVPESLKNQSDIFNKLNTPNYEMTVTDLRQLCDGALNKDIDRAFERHRKKRAEAELVQYITVFNNQLKGHFLPPQGVPDNACLVDGVYYNPEALQESLNLRPSSDQKVVSLKKAHELFNYAKAMDDIAWNYKGDGCYARAHLMARRFEAMGVHVDKAWLKGELKAPEVEGELPISWNFHVAPVVYVKGEGGALEKMIIDPSTFDAPVPATVWQAALSNSDNKVEETSFPFPKNSVTYSRTSIAFSSSDPYLQDDTISMSEAEKMNQAAKTMKLYKGY